MVFLLPFTFTTPPPLPLTKKKSLSFSQTFQNPPLLQLFTILTIYIYIFCPLSVLMSFFLLGNFINFYSFHCSFHQNGFHAVVLKTIWLEDERTIDSTRVNSLFHPLDGTFFIPFWGKLYVYVSVK